MLTWFNPHECFFGFLVLDALEELLSLRTCGMSQTGCMCEGPLLQRSLSIHKYTYNALQETVRGANV